MFLFAGLIRGFLGCRLAKDHIHLLAPRRPVPNNRWEHDLRNRSCNLRSRVRGYIVVKPRRDYSEGLGNKESLATNVFQNNEQEPHTLNTLISICIYMYLYIKKYLDRWT